MLIDEATVRRYRADLTDEIEPQIGELISRATKGLEILQRRESALKSKVKDISCEGSSLMVRFLQVETLQAKPLPRSTINTTGMNKLEARRLHMLVKERERAEQELAALQAEVEDMVSASYFLTS